MLGRPLSPSLQAYAWLPCPVCRLAGCPGLHILAGDANPELSAHGTERAHTSHTEQQQGGGSGRAAVLAVSAWLVLVAGAAAVGEWHEHLWSQLGVYSITVAARVAA